MHRRHTRRLVLPGDMPRSFQDISESGGEDIQGGGHDGSVPVFNHVDTDDDTDSVTDAPQRNLEGDEILAETPGESRGSTLVVPEPVPIAPPRRRRLVFVQGSQVEEVETAPHEEGSIFGTSDEGVFADREPDIAMPEVRENSAAIREGFRRLDAENLTTIFETRANVLKTVPQFLKGPYRSAMGIAHSEAHSGDELRYVKWKSFLLLPRMLLSRKPRGGLISRENLTRRFSLFSQGRWTELIRASERDAEEAATARRRRPRKTGSTSSDDGPVG